MSRVVRSNCEYKANSARVLVPDPHEHAVAVSFYCGCFTVTAVFYFLMWLHAARGRRLIADHISDDAVRAITRA